MSESDPGGGEWCSPPLLPPDLEHEHVDPESGGLSPICGRCYRGALEAEARDDFPPVQPARCENSGCGTGALLDEYLECPRCGWFGG